MTADAASPAAERLVVAASWSGCQGDAIDDCIYDDADAGPLSRATLPWQR